MPTRVVIVSNQRSGSTAMMHRVASEFACGVELNESLGESKARAGGLLRFPKLRSLPLSAVVERQNQPIRLLDLVQRQLCAARCDARLARSAECVGVLKLFRSHFVTSPGMRELLGDDGTWSIVLRRNVRDVECSWQFARASGRWYATAAQRDASETSNYSRFRNRRCRPLPTNAFRKKINLWHELTNTGLFAHARHPVAFVQTENSTAFSQRAHMMAAPLVNASSWVKAALSSARSLCRSTAL